VNAELLQGIEAAKAVLARNWLGRSTKPSPHLYPHQWNWDSGFIAIGYARYDQQRAQQELTSLFEAQWKNGMLPQIVFNEAALGGYFPEPDFWQSERSPHYPEGVQTSGITMPPVHAMAALRIMAHATDCDAALSWLRGLYPKLVALHAYLYRDRDPHGEGLVYIRHPWESGLDNSPVWDQPLRAMQLRRAALPKYERRDLKTGVSPSQRPTDDDYDRYVYLVDLFRLRDYDEDAIREDCPFLVQDPSFNAILCKATQDLAVLGRLLGQDVTQLELWESRTREALRSKLWHAVHGAYDNFDLVAGARIGTLTAAGFMPLLAGAPSEAEAAVLFRFLESRSFCSMHDGACFSIPNYNVEGAYFDAKNYWRGPVWINTNWLLMQGLYRYGFDAKAVSVRHDILELVARWGFHEYFDPFEGRGYGAKDFSWSAALYIDAAFDDMEGRTSPLEERYRPGPPGTPAHGGTE
jgi:hypothetical protein